MFFILSKVLLFLLRPINWIFFLLIWSLWTKKIKRRRRLLLYATGLFFIFSNTIIINLAYHWWEENPEYSFEQSQPFDAAVLLGGYSDPKIQPSDDRHNFGYYSNRFTNALELYHKGYFKNWILSGGSGRLIEQETSEAPEVRDFLLTLGIPDSVIFLDDSSRNTRENALNSKIIIEQHFPNNRILLITSAWHMPRAKGCFEQLDLKVTPYLADYRSRKFGWTPDQIFLPNPQALNEWNYLLKEWIGFWVYKLRGWS